MPIVLSYPVWMRWGIRLGVPLFAVLSIYLFYLSVAAYDGGVGIASFFYAGLGMYIARLTWHGTILLPYLDSLVEFDSQGFCVIKDEIRQQYSWQQPLEMENFVSSQVLRIRDGSGETILAIDHQMSNYESFAEYLEWRERVTSDLS